MFHPIYGMLLAMAKTHFAMAITEIHNIIIVLIIGNTYNYSEKNNNYCNYYN